MKRIRIQWIASALLAAAAWCQGQEKAAIEPVVAALEPVALRTALARSLPDAKFTVIVPAKEDSVLGISHYTKEEFAAAGLDWDQFMTKATAAATRLLVSIKPVVAKDASGQVAYIKLQSDRPFTASVVLSPRMVPLFQGVLGDRLVALMPDRNTVYLFSRNFGQFQSFGQKILNDHAEAIYPCSIEVFEISRDGIKCLGGFDDGAEPPPSVNPAASSPKPEIPRKETPTKTTPRVEIPLRKTPPPEASPKKNP
jgi:hypothetical protein